MSDVGKKYDFDQNALQIAISMVVAPFCHPVI
jgi:hypothetical protein